MIIDVKNNIIFEFYTIFMDSYPGGIRISAIPIYSKMRLMKNENDRLIKQQIDLVIDGRARQWKIKQKKSRDVICVKGLSNEAGSSMEPCCPHFTWWNHVNELYHSFFPISNKYKYSMWIWNGLRWRWSIENKIPNKLIKIIGHTNISNVELNHLLITEPRRKKEQQFD